LTSGEAVLYYVLVEKRSTPPAPAHSTGAYPANRPGPECPGPASVPGALLAPGALPSGPVYFHGSPYRLEAIRPPAETGVCREADRRHSREVVFLTDDVRLALEYAGRDGFVYQVAPAGAALPYSDPEGKKQVRSGIFVAPAAEILRTWSVSRKRNRPVQLRLAKGGVA